MRKRRSKTPARDPECGVAATKKVGLIWICDFHWKRFGVPTLGEEHFATCTGAVDADGSNWDSES